jgi:hypothetical protein
MVFLAAASALQVSVDGPIEQGFTVRPKKYQKNV